MKKRNVKNDGKTIDLIFLILFAGSALYFLVETMIGHLLPTKYILIGISCTADRCRLVISKHPLIKTRLMAALSFKSSIGWRAFIRRRLSDAYP